MKKCTKCKQLKKFASFYPNKKLKSGFNSVCKECLIKYIREYKRSNPIYRKAQQKLVDLWRKKHMSCYIKYAKKYRKEKKIERYAQKKAQKIKILGDCYFCHSEENLLRHHFDYSKAEEFIILCKGCHTKLHIILKVTK